MSEETRATPVWLFVSVLLNILMLGLVIGYLIGRPAGGPDAAPYKEGGPGPFRTEGAIARGIIEVTPDNERRSVIRDMRRAMIGSGDQVRGRLAARRDLLAALRAEPFDEARVRAALARLAAADNRLQSALHAELVETLAQMPADQRAALADMVETSPRRPHRRGPRPE